MRFACILACPGSTGGLVRGPFKVRRDWSYLGTPGVPRFTLHFHVRRKFHWLFHNSDRMISWLFFFCFEFVISRNTFEGLYRVLLGMSLGLPRLKDFLSTWSSQTQNLFGFSEIACFFGMVKARELNIMDCLIRLSSIVWWDYISSLVLVSHASLWQRDPPSWHIQQNFCCEFVFYCFGLLIIRATPPRVTTLHPVQWWVMISHHVAASVYFCLPLGWITCTTAGWEFRKLRRAALQKYLEEVETLWHWTRCHHKQRASKLNTDNDELGWQSRPYQPGGWSYQVCSFLFVEKKSTFRKKKYVSRPTRGVMCIAFFY